VTLFLLRHAETVFNATRVVQPPDTPLSERGRTQAARVAERLAADVLHERTGAPLDIDPDLRERDYGAIRGRPYAELADDIFAPDYVPPDGESWEQFHQRVDRAWSGIVAAAARTPQPLVVVTHGLVCFSLLSRHVVVPTGDAVSMRFGNTSVTVVDGPDPWRAQLIDCTAHLDPTLRADGARA
jgi:broad specificity phosphatase PhoE